MKKVYLDSVGCRLNQGEIQHMAREFESVGYVVVENPAEADVHVVNTCTVTSDANKVSRKLIRQLNRANQEAEIAVTGCYAHVAPQAVADLPGVAHVVSNLDKDKLVALVTGQQPDIFDLEPMQRHVTPGMAGMTRAFIKVQDGCDNKCTFCLTTLARGASRSLPLENIVREVQLLADMGYQEAVLTGVNLGAYGYDWGDQRGLFHLIEALLSATDIPRLRLSSLEPWNLDADFFGLWANPRLCRHLHIPLQSGCDSTLKRMLRRTSQAEFRALMAAARAVIPEMGISTDVIVGFPGETDEEFAESLAFIAAMDFMKIHVFPYSVREGTPAARLRGRIAPETIKERLQSVQALSDAGMTRYYERHIGRTLPVLWEGVRGASEAGFLHTGLSDNYIKVEITHPDILTNQILPTTLTHISGDGMGGQLAIQEGVSYEQ